MDLVGPLEMKDGKKGYILTMLDPHAHFLVAEVIPDKTAESVLDAFVRRILLEGRMPSAIVTALDLGFPLFCNRLQ